MEPFKHYFLDTLQYRYAQFEGRATRSEYWYFLLFYFIFSLLASLLDTYLLNPLLGVIPEQGNQGGILSMVLGLGLLIPSIGIGIRRLHDTGKSGWWLLIGFIPIVGIFLLIFFYIQDSQPETNLYGPNPKIR